MTKAELVKDMKNFYPIGFMNTTQIAVYLGWGRDRVRAEITDGLEFLGSGKTKQFFVGDVADRIIQAARRTR